MFFHVLEDSGPVVGRHDFDVGFAKGFFLIFCWQQKCRSGIIVVSELDPENALLIVKHLLD
jgi:hypothetical protein